MYILSADIEHEEGRVGVRDGSDPAYPVLARSLRVRRENIGATIGVLEDFRSQEPAHSSTLDKIEREAVQAII